MGPALPFPMLAGESFCNAAASAQGLLKFELINCCNLTNCVSGRKNFYICFYGNAHFYLNFACSAAFYTKMRTKKSLNYEKNCDIKKL